MEKLSPRYFLLPFANKSGGASSVSNSDGTLTISPTTGAVVASLNLTNANTWTAKQTISVADAGAFTVGANGATNPTLQVDSSEASSATGILIEGFAAASGVTIETLSSGTNENLLIDAKGTGTIGLNTVGTTSGLVTLGNSTSLAGVQINGVTTVTSASASALAVGLAGATNPVLKIDASLASVATGLNIKGAAAAAGLAVSVISSGTNENLTIDAKGTGTVTINGVATGIVALPANSTIGGSVPITTPLTSSSATAFGVGPNGATNPTFNIDASTASAATGFNIKSAAATGGLALKVISSGTNENLVIDAKGSGTISLNSVANGKINLGNSSTPNGIQVYGAVVVTTSNACYIGQNGSTNAMLAIRADWVGSPVTGLTILPNSAGSGIALSAISSGTNENFTIDAKGSGTIKLNGTATGGILLGQKITNYNNIATAGWGVSAIQAENDLFGQTANVASIVTYTPSVEGTFEIVIIVNVTGTAVGITPQVTYTDHNSVAQTDALALDREGVALPVLTATAVDRYFATYAIRAKITTAIVVKTTGYVSGTYDVSAWIKQIG